MARSERRSRGLRHAALVACLPLAGACATTGGTAGDPFEPVNRAVYEFNDVVDRYALKPVAQGYRDYVPEVLRFVVGNVFSNLGDLYTALNQALQGKPRLALQDMTRFVVNSTLGLGGIADLASDLGLEKHYEDFGQTLGRWGMPSGPYVVIPFLGPSTLRDTPTRFLVDSYGDLLWHYPYVPERNIGVGLRLVDLRASLLAGERVVDGAALDKYSLIRDGYLQRRRNQVFDGEPPEDKMPDYEAEDKAADSADKAAGGGAGAGASGAGAKTPAR